MGLITLASLGLAAALSSPIDDVALVIPMSESPRTLMSLGLDDGDEPAAAPAASAEVIALLDRLEHAGDDLETLTASVVHDSEEVKFGERTRRIGTIIYDARPADGRHVAIRFDKRVISSDGRNVLRDEMRQYVFGGIWLGEYDYDRTLFIKRQIARPGETFDPLKLGEGPFPFPIGQRRDEVLKRFDVELASPPTEGLLATMAPDGATIDGLRLVPKVVSRATREIDELFLYFDRATGLPRGVEIRRKNGAKVETARFADLAKNTTLTTDQTSWLSLDAPEGWTVDIRPLAADDAAP